MRLITDRRFVVVLGSFLASGSAALPVDTPAGQIASALGGKVGIVAVIDLPGEGPASVTDLLQDNQLVIYFQSEAASQVAAVRERAAQTGDLGRRLTVERAGPTHIGLANNLADCVLVGPTAAGKVDRGELMRVLRPKGSAFVGQERMIKPIPEGIDHWTHPYHGPDNNPQSQDKLAQGEFRTQFIARPKFSPMPQQTVTAGGRIYKALGHIAHRKNQNPHLNTLLCINAYNGMILWRKPLPEGFMIHRNTMVATEDALYIGDHESCKVIDGRLGSVRGQFTVPKEIADGPVWKWMAIQNGTLFALIGNKEVRIDTQRAKRRGLGHWPWGMWQGHDYKDPKTSFGFGRTLVAIDVTTRQLRWHLKTDAYLDGRAVAMNKTTIFAYSPGHALMAVECRTGKIVWKQTGGKAIEAIGPNQKAQHYKTGYATTCYMKCNEDYLFFAGPQRKQMAVVSAKTGELAWTHPDGNLQLVLREDGIYGAGPSATGLRLAYDTGAKLGSLPTRRACTRATGSVDSIFYRTRGGTVRVLTPTNTANHIAAMRPACQDGVLISNGHLYWGPWMCGCQLSLYGSIGLGAVSRSFPADASLYSDAHIVFGDVENIAPLGLKPGDCPVYRADNERSDYTSGKLPPGIKPLWKTKVVAGALPTGPVTGGGLVFVADRTGTVQAVAATGKPVWRRHTAGPVYFPPTIAEDRVFVGSADGRVYAFEARTGRPLWRFRVAPADERIHVFGDLISRWPVAGGVVVRDGTLYAAAGIANYDGTYVVALDAVSGNLKARNSTSGKLAPQVNGGISLQGPLSIVGDELRFPGGGVYEIARYNLATLKCLNEPINRVTGTHQTAFYPYYPHYGKFVSLQYKCLTGVMIHAASYEGNRFGNIALQTPPQGKSVPTGEDARKALRRRGQLTKGQRLWQDARNRRFTAFIASEDLLIATGHTEAKPAEPFIVATRPRNGFDLWQHKLPADAVKGGMAMDHAGRLFVCLENGELHCFEPDEEAQPEAAPPVDMAPPTETKLVFLADQSMKLYDKGKKIGEFPTQETIDPMGPFNGKGVYFRPDGGQDKTIVYQIQSAKPVRRIHYKGVATFRMKMAILDLKGDLIYASAGPFNKGNVYSEHTVDLPEHIGHRFLLRLYNEATVWFYIEKLTLE